MERGHTVGSSIDDVLELRQRQLSARLRLGLMKQLERLVDNLAQLPERNDLTPERVEFWRMIWRTQYEQAIGVTVEQRDLLQTRLQQVAESGSHTVEQIIAEVRDAQRNRFCGGADREGGGGAV
jgi:hypothetical protein